MTTVLDPGGTPVPVYNQSGTTIDTITANGMTQGTATPIVRYGGTTIVLVHITAGDAAVLLPANAEIGDLFEVYCDDINLAVRLFAPGSDTFLSSGGNVVAASAWGYRVRKVGPSLWVAIT